MATRSIVPRANGEGSIGTEKKHWGGAFFDKLSVKTLEVIGGEAENDAQPATVGWVKSKFQDFLKNTLKLSGLGWDLEKSTSSGYIYLGKLFGGLVIEFVYFNTNNSSANNEQEKPLPLSLRKLFYGHVGVFGYGYTDVNLSGGLTTDLARLQVKFGVGKERANPVYGIVIGTI